MRVSVYKLDDGAMAVLVEASPGRGLSPVMLSDVTPENVEGRLTPLIEEMRRPRQTQLS